jgi:imidazole glycerol-phosphate synthase subunit HisH
MIHILDTSASNSKSLYNALDHLNIKFEITKNIKELKNSTHIILPGVGSYKNLINNLEKNYNIRELKKLIQKNNVIFLGICVGMQILSTVGYEIDKTKGLDIIKGDVKKIDTKFKLPHVGWNSVFFDKENSLLKNIDTGTDFYFTHSYEFISGFSQNIIGTTFYEKKITSIIQNKNIYGVQFHPEKSQEQGLKLISNFSKI